MLNLIEISTDWKKLNIFINKLNIILLINYLNFNEKVLY